MRTDQLIEQLRWHGELLARAAEVTSPDAPVPSCPGWTAASAVGHIAKVHRWACWILRGHDRQAFSYQRPAPDELIAQYRAGLVELAEVLQASPDTLTAYTLWPAASARTFWARRQAHETAIHAVDLQLAADYGIAEIDSAFAADGLDELLMNMAGEQFGSGGHGGSRLIAITPLDANQSWTVQVSPTGTTVRPAAEDGADLSVFGLAADLYRWAWNRAGDHEVGLRGDVSLADRWRADFRIGVRRD